MTTGHADLHRHLDGSLRRATLAELAAAAGVDVPADLTFHAGMGLDGALARFALTLSVLQAPDSVHRVASEMCEDAAADGVTTLEIRFAPQLHGGSIHEVVAAAIEGAAGRAGIILCALYGEDPAVLLELVRVGADCDGVVGIDLAGGPASGHDFAMSDYAPAFRLAAEAGLGRTVHAGEGRPAEEIRVAVDLLGAQRIGHGVTILDDPSVVDLVIERGVTLEACPTSNVHTGVIPAVADHPVAAWLDRGLHVCVCTDNTLFSDVSLSTELGRVRAIDGMDDSKMAALARNGHDAAFRAPGR